MNDVVMLKLNNDMPQQCHCDRSPHQAVRSEPSGIGMSIYEHKRCVLNEQFGYIYGIKQLSVGLRGSIICRFLRFVTC